MRVINASREDHVYRRFDERVTGLYEPRSASWGVGEVLDAVEVIPNVTLIIVLGIGAYAAGTAVTMGTLVAFITMICRWWPFASLVSCCR
jgi:ATP-binding cassette subfamily B protein